MLILYHVYLYPLDGFINGFVSRVGVCSQVSGRRRSSTRSPARAWRTPWPGRAPRAWSRRARATRCTSAAPRTYWTRCRALRNGTGAVARTTSTSGTSSPGCLSTRANAAAASARRWTCTTTKPAEWWVDGQRNYNNPSPIPPPSPRPKSTEGIFMSRLKYTNSLCCCHHENKMAA